MINEIYTGNRFRRFVHKHLPFGWGGSYEDRHTRYQIPETLDFSLPQPGGNVLYCKGSRRDLDIVCLTRKGSISFKDLSVEGTRFAIYDSYMGPYFTNRDLLVGIPSDFLGMKNPIRWFLHEIAHLWSWQDKEWELRYFDAVNITRKGQVLEAEKVIGQEERRAEAIWLYMESRLRNAGFGLMPGMSVSSLRQMVNDNAGLRKKYSNVSSFDFRFNNHDVSAVMSGEIPWPNLKGIIDEHLNTLLAMDPHFVARERVELSRGCPQ